MVMPATAIMGAGNNSVGLAGEPISHKADPFVHGGVGHRASPSVSEGKGAVASIGPRVRQSTG